MSTVEIITWVIIIFIAGFIGYFGRHLSKKIIEKFEKKELRRLSKYEFKLEKKRLKAKKKKKK